MPLELEAHHQQAEESSLSRVDTTNGGSQRTPLMRRSREVRLSRHTAPATSSATLYQPRIGSREVIKVRYIMQPLAAAMLAYNLELIVPSKRSSSVPGRNPIQ